MQQCCRPAALSRVWNEPERVDRVRVEYRDPNDAGVSPALDPALLLARSAHQVLASYLLAAGPMQKSQTRPGALPDSRIRGSTGDRYNDARDFRTRTNRAVGNAGLVPSQREPRSGLQIEVRA